MTNSAMTSIVLSQLLPEHNLGSAADMAVRGLSLDSRTVRSGEVFVALSGALHDGRDYIQAALARGAAAALVEADARWCEPVFEPVPIIPVANLAAQLSAIAGRFYQHPSERLRSEEHTSELQSRGHLVCRLLLEKKNSTVQLQC